jgi:hypothetical protein
MEQTGEVHELVLVHLLDVPSAGAMFNQWPLHLTIMPWIEIPDMVTAVEAITESLKGIKSIPVALGDEAHFGPHQDLEVTLAQQNPELLALHKKLLGVIALHDWTLRGNYTGDQYKPHISHKAGKKPTADFILNSVSIIEALPQNYRRIVATIPLS